MLGTFLTGIILFFIGIGIIASMISGLKKEEINVPSNSILQLTLSNEIFDRASNNPMQSFDFASLKSKSASGLNDILKCISKAKKDNNIKGILLDVSDIKAGFASVAEIRNELIDFKKSGKFIVSYSEAYSQKSYFLASVADKIYVNPEGMVDFRGLAAEIMFYKGTLQKLDIEAQIIRHGKYKSAIEPFILDKMSDANKEQTLTFISSIWNDVLQKISDSRKVPVKELNEIANTLALETAQDAVKLKFADATIYKDELLALLQKKAGIDSEKTVSLITLDKYMLAPSTEKVKREKDKIAVIYAIGQIESGEGNDVTIGSERISKAIRDARQDDNIKAIVLRVNSPGGSALASEIIWREVILAKKVKPVVVSMGDVAASGGYYIACGANKIFADPTTITGSIGVFGMIPNLKKFFNNKLGITIDGVKTNSHADYLSTMHPMETYEYNVMQKSIENIYTTFITHVADGRKLSVEQVDSIGQGRVWSGADAKRIGLVDDFGGLQKAIEAAAKLAKIEAYRVVDLPKQKDAFTQIIESLSGKSTSVQFIQEQLGDNFTNYQYLQSIKKMKGVQALMPFTIEIH